MPANGRWDLTRPLKGQKFRILFTRFRFRIKLQSAGVLNIYIYI